jgi:hypothetical protein
MLRVAFGGAQLPVLDAGSQRFAAGVVSPDAAGLAAVSLDLSVGCQRDRRGRTLSLVMAGVEGRLR